MIARHEGALKRTARRFSLDAEDAEDAYQRALEIALTKAPTTDPRELIRWTQTVTKHEALAVRESRERLLGSRRPREDAPDPLASIPAEGGGPGEQAERREDIARSREALRALKPAELRALSLLASGYSYAEIGEITGFSRTKVNRVLAEGRDRFRALVSSSEDGSRCRELGPLLSAFCDGEASPGDAAKVREHLRACASCRSTMRAYRAAPRIALGLAPALPPSRSLLERAHEQLTGLVARLPAEVVPVFVGTACLATGMIPLPFTGHEQVGRPPVERRAERLSPATLHDAPRAEPAAPAVRPKPPSKERPPAEVEEAAPAQTSAPAAAVEYEPPPPPPEAPPPSPPEGAAPSGSAAGEFGP